MSRATSGEHERRLATGTIALQATQALTVLAAIGITTLLARSLTVPAFGTYGLMVAFAQVFVFAHVSVEQAGIRLLAAASGDEPGRRTALSVALAAYGCIGTLAGLVIVGATFAFAGALGIPEALRSDARLGAVLIAVAVAAGWPLSVTRDVLRAEMLFRRAALADGLGYVLMALLTVVLVLAEAPLWALIGVGGTVLLLQGWIALLLAWWAGVMPSPAHRVDTREIHAFARASGGLLVLTATDLVIYSLDRVILSAFTSVRQVALYEGPSRAHQLVRLTAGSLSSTVLPSATRYRAEGDERRTHDLLVRGTRYVLALVVPLVVVLCALAEPLLGAWLGARYEPAAAALAILVSYWVLNANTVVASGMLVAHHRVGWLARYAWSVAAANLVASLALTAALGLEGVVLGTTLTYAIATPIFVVSAARFLGVPLRDLLREAWIPAYSTGAALALALVAVRTAFEVDGLLPVVVVGVAGMLGYWLAFAAVWLRPAERRLALDVARGMLRA